MKKLMIKIATMLVMVALASLVIGFNSCKEDEDEDPVIVLDGFYVKGGSTTAADFNDNAIMKATRNEIGQADRAQLLELYIAVKAGDPGFNIVKVAGDVRTTYGPGADFLVVPEADRITDEPKIDFWRGSFTETASVFTVPADGLYHIVIDTEYNKVIVVPVVWGVIGAATPGGWGSSTVMPATGFDLNTITFEETDVVMTKADFKFRYSDGWKVVLDTTNDNGAGLDKGVRVNTNYGGAVDALVPGGANISNTVPGKYTLKMVWTFDGGNVATVTKTGDLDLINYTDTELGLVGDGLFVGGVQQTWDVTIMLHKPVIENETNYIWTYEGVEVQTVGSFKIREGQDWTKKSIGYNDVTMAGLAADKFGTNTDGNFVPLEDGTYDIEFKIDAVTETYTFTVNPTGATPELYMLGDGCTAGWVNTAALPMNGTGGEYTLTTVLGAAKQIKFITTLGQWAPMYGTDGTGTSTSGPLVYRATESDPDPTSIPTPATEGTYTVSVNTNTMTYTITAK